MKVEFEIIGIPGLQKQLKEYGEEMRKEIAREVRRSTLRVSNAAIKRIQTGPASGRTYEKYSPRRTHKASAKGEPPMTDTGRLASSVETRVDGLTGYIFTRLDYGKHLEFGTKNIDPRPWLNPSIEEERPKFINAIKGLLR